VTRLNGTQVPLKRPPGKGKAHNRLVDQGRSFEEARRLVRQHYQHIVLTTSSSGSPTRRSSTASSPATGSTTPGRAVPPAARVHRCRVPLRPRRRAGRLDTLPDNRNLADLLRFAKVVGGGAAPRTYKVKKGDTLSGIAGRKLGDAGRWPEIARLNRDIVPDPDELFPGQVLVILKR
jgi:nucleoid-associated protein YgaU